MKNKIRFDKMKLLKIIIVKPIKIFHNNGEILMKKFLILALLALNTTVYTQIEKKTITLEKAIDMALKQNLNVIQARNNLNIQESSYLTTIGGLLPNLNASGSFYRRQDWRPPTGTRQQFIPGFGFIDIPGTSGYSASNSYSTSVSSSVTLFNGFANIANVNRALSNIKSSENNYERTKQSIIYQTHQLYLNVVRTYQLMKVNEENLKRSQRQLERIEESNRVGSVSLADVYRQRVATGNDELALINAQSNYEKAKADLALFLSIDQYLDYEFDVTEFPTDIDTSEFNEIIKKYSDVNSLFKQALLNRPDYKASENNLYSAASSLTIARSGLYPSVSASASYNLSNEQLSKISDNRSLSFNLGISLPIFSGFQTKNAIEQATINRNFASDQLKQNERQILVDIQKAKLDIEAALKQLKVTQTSVASAEMDLKIAEEKYNLGAGTLLDLLIANANYINALSNKVNSVMSYLLSQKQMEYALGIINN